MEIEQVDERDREKEEVGEDPHEPLKSRLELQPRQQVERPDPKREEQRLDDQQRLRAGDECVERHEQEIDRGKVIAQVGMRLRLDQAHRRLEETAPGCIPEHLVENAQVRSEGVVGQVAQHRQDAIEDEVRRSQACRDEGLDANHAALDVTHGERDI